MKVSYYKNISDTQGTQADFSAILNGIKVGRWQSEVLNYRDLRERLGKKKSDKTKRSLPNFTGSGLFYEREDRLLKQHSNRIIIDFDGVEDVTEAKKLLSSDKYTEYCFLSCSGKGLAVVVKIDGNKHRDSFKQLKEYYHTTYDLKVDESCVNESRTRFISYDAELFYNGDSKQFEVKKNTPVKKERNRTNYTDAYKVLKPAVEIIERSSDGTRYHARLKAGKLAGGYVGGGDVTDGEAIDILMEAVRTVSENSDRNLDICKKQLEAAIEHGKQYPTTFQDRKTFAQQNDPSYHTAPPHRVEDEIPQEQYLKDNIDKVVLDEELLNKTLTDSPRFSEDVYSDLNGETLLPYMIGRGCEYFTGVQRDMYLVSCLIGFSSLFPKVSTKYFGKRVYANMYGFILAIAGTGKGVVNDVEKILSGVDEYKDNEYKEIIAELTAEAEADEKNKNNKIIEPTPLQHIIPLDITGASLTDLLQANNNCFAYTTEIDEMTSSMSSGYGDIISSMLRKVYHHEKSSSYRATNKEKRVLEKNKLSLLLAGTPEQFHKLIPSVENGLFSRFCIYSGYEQPVFKNPFEQKYNDFEYIMLELKEYTLQKYLSFLNTERNFSFTENQQKTFYEAGKKELEYYTKLLGDEAIAVINRHFFMINRIAMTLTCCKYDADEFGKEIICNDTEFFLAFELLNTMKVHAFNLFNQVTGNVNEIKPKISEKGKSMLLFERLPKEFTTEEAYKVGESLNITKKAVRNHLSRLKSSGTIDNGEIRGKWLKILE